MEWFTLAFLSAIFSAVAAVFQKKILTTTTVIHFILWLSIIDFLLAIPFFFVANWNLLSIMQISIVGIKTIFACLSFALIMFGLKKLEIGRALPWMILTPALVALGGSLFLNEKLSFTQIVGIFFVIIGSYLLQIKSANELKKLSIWNGFETAHIYIFAALLVTTTSALLDRVVLDNYKVNPFLFLPLQQSMQLLIFGIFFIPLCKRRADVTPGTFLGAWQNNRNLIIMVSVATLLYRLFQIKAVALAPVAIVLSVKRLSVLMAVIVSGKIFNEKEWPLRALGTAIILIGTSLVVI